MTVVSGCSPVKAEKPMSGLTEQHIHRNLGEGRIKLRIIAQDEQGRMNKLWKEEGDDAGTGTGTRAVAGWRGVWDDFLGGGTRPSRESRGTRLANPEEQRTSWLATTRPDGRPHLMPVIAFWIDGAIHIVAGEGTRKARNFAANGRCVIATSSTTLSSLDIVIEGRADPLIEGDAVGHIAEVLSASGWPLEAKGDKVCARTPQLPARRRT
jgi:hypothetical protein